MGLLEDINFEKNYLIYFSVIILFVMFIHINYLNSQMENMTNTSVKSELAEHIKKIYKAADLLRRNQLKVPQINAGAIRIGNEETYWEIKSKQDDGYNLVFTNYTIEGNSSGLDTLRRERGSFSIKRFASSNVLPPILNNVREQYLYSKRIINS